jgi:hypothetical protein
MRFVLRAVITVCAFGEIALLLDKSVYGSGVYAIIGESELVELFIAADFSISANRIYSQGHTRMPYFGEWILPRSLRPRGGRKSGLLQDTITEGDLATARAAFELVESDADKMSLEVRQLRSRD